MTTKCKHCGKRREDHYEKIDGRVCCNPNGKGTVFEPSTEGTQAAQPQFGFFRCLSCGFNGTISTDEIAKHRAQCSHGPTVPMSQAEWEARGEPAPVAQVDAPREDVEFNRVMKLYCGDDFNMQAGFQRAWLYLHVHGIPQPAVAQTELPLIPDDLTYDYEYAKRSGSDHLVPGYLTVQLIERIASLTQRLREQGAELKTVLDRESTSQKRHDDRMDALQKSHDALLPYAKSWQVELKKTCWNNENLNAAIANAEKLRGQ